MSEGWVLDRSRVSTDPAFIRLERRIQEEAVKEFARLASNPVALTPVNTCSLMAHIERDLWRQAAIRLMERDTAAVQVIMEIAGS